MVGWNECLRKRKYSRVYKVTSEITARWIPKAFTVSKHFASLHFLSSYIQCQGDPGKHQHWEWQVAGPSWPLSRMCIQSLGPAKCTRAVLDPAVPALMPACRAAGQQILRMGLCREESCRHTRLLSRGLSWKEDPRSTHKAQPQMLIWFYFSSTSSYIYLQMYRMKGHLLDE